MKRILTTLALLVATTILLAQVPQKFSYQGVIRDAAGNLVRNAPVGVRVSILKNSTEGVAVYCETHRQSTNANGLLTLTIGEGSVVGGDMAAIDWANGPYFLKTETDITGGSNYTLVGAQQLLSVPYALYAGNTTNAFSGDYNDLSNKPEIPQVPTEVSAFTNDAGYISNKECDNLSYCQLVSQLAKLQNTVDSLKEQIGESGGSGQGDIGNDGKPCKGVATVMDVDSNIYNTVQIGEQCWMKENLKTSRYADGTAISTGSSSSTTTPYCYGGTYGFLYNWPAVMGGCFSSTSVPSGVQGVCPNGWHVPSDQEWIKLVNYLIMQPNYNYGKTVRGLIAKGLASTTGWNNNSDIATVGCNQESNDITGFSAFPDGYYYPYGTTVGVFASFWSATQNDTNQAYDYTIKYNSSSINRFFLQNKAYGLSVRCLKD